MSDDVGVDGTAIWEIIDRERRSRGDLTWRALASEAGLSPSTLSRLAQGHTPTVDGMVRLADWLGLTVDELLGRKQDRIAGDVAPPTAIASYLRTRKELDETGVEALEAIFAAAYDKLRRQEHR